MNMKKKLFGFLLAMIMVVGLLPTMSFAGTGTAVKAIELGTGAILGPTTNTSGDETYKTPNSYIYFGVNSENSSTPIKWRVLDANKDNNGNTDRMFLLSEYLLKYGVKFNEYNRTGNSNIYQGSIVQTWCKSFANNTSNFSPAEQSTMVGISKTDSAVTLYGSNYGSSSLNGDQMFLLSVRELADYVSNKNKSSRLKATTTYEMEGNWWLRSPDGDNLSHYVARVNASTYYVGYRSTYGAWDTGLWTRPAFNMYKDKVLFTSAASGGKSAGGMDSGLTAVNEYTGNEWKMTLKDASRNFSISEGTASVKAGSTVTLNYSGATTGTNEYISAILTDENGVAYYGRVKKVTSNAGTVEISIPDGVSAGTYTLKVFNEQYNGDYKTDLASAFCDVSLTVAPPTEAKIGTVEYNTFAEALTAAGNNTTADKIQIISEEVTLEGTGTLKAGDSVEMYRGYGTYTAINDSKLSLLKDEDYDVGFLVSGTGSKVQIGTGTGLYFANGATAVGNSGEEITVPAENEQKVIGVLAGDMEDEESTDTDTVLVLGTVSVQIGNMLYENPYETYELSHDGIAYIKVTKNDGNNLLSGSLTFDKNNEITVGGKKIKNTADKTITVKANEPDGWNSTVVPAGGKAEIGGVEYEAGSKEATFLTDESANVTLAVGEAKLDKDEQINVGTGSVPVINKADKTITVTAKDDGTAKTTIPAGGKAKINNTEITAAEGETAVGIGTDGALAVSVNPGKVTIGYITFTGDVKLTVSPNGAITVVNGNVTIDEQALDDSFAYELLPGQSATIGSYTYTAPAEGSKGDVTIKGRGTDKNPAVVLKNTDGTVDVSLANDQITKTTYTAAAENTMFAMADGDADANIIKLLSNGNTSANSKVKVLSGVTVQSSISPLTAAADDTLIGLDGSLNAVLENGRAKTAGSMFAGINGAVKLFYAADGNPTPYIVDTNEKTLTVAAGVVVTDDTGTKFTNGVFTFGTNEDGLTVKVSAGASVIGRNWEENSSTITGVNDDTIVSIYDNYGSICLIGGKGQSDGLMDVQIGEDTWSFAGEGNKYTVDTGETICTLTLDEEGTVSLEDEIFFAGKANDSFTIDMDEYTVTIPEGATVTGSNGNAVTGVGDGTQVTADEDGNVTLTGGSGKTTGKMVAVLTGIGETAFDGDGTSYTVNTVDAALVLNENGTVKMGEGMVEFEGETDDSFTFGTDATGLTVKLSDGAGVTGRDWEENPSTITGVDDDTVVSIYDEYGSICLISGKGQSDGVMDVQIGQYLWSFAGEGNKYTVDTNGMLTLDEEGTVAFEDGIWFSGKENDSFAIDIDEYTVTIPEGATVTGSNGIAVTGIARAEGGKDTKAAIGYSDDKYTITLFEGPGIITIINAGDEYTVGGQTYVAASDNLTFSVDEEGVVKLISGSALLKDGESIIGASGNAITNPADSDDDELIVTAEDGKDTVIVPRKGARVKIGKTEYETAADNTKITVDENGSTLTDGSVKLDDGESIIGASGKLITNPADSGKDQITVIANTPKAGQDTVIVPADGKVKIGDTDYIADSDGVTLVVGSDGKASVTAGSLKSADPQKTGDSNNLALWIIILSAACAVIVGTTVYSRRKRRTR